MSLNFMWACSLERLQLNGMYLCYRGSKQIELPGAAGSIAPFLMDAPGVFPTKIKGQDAEFHHPMSALMGVGGKDGLRHVWGRTLARLLGQSLGVPEGALHNDPDLPVHDHSHGSDAGLGRVGPDSYGEWSAIRYVVPTDDKATADVDESEGTALPRKEQDDPNHRLQDGDVDGDSIVEKDDNCPGIQNPSQELAANSMVGLACSSDMDGDGLLNPFEAIPPPEFNTQRARTFSSAEPAPTSEEDATFAASGAAESADHGFDPFPNDTDNDGINNSDDLDDDGDGKAATRDNCAFSPNPGQEDSDSDGRGDACDEDDDGDGLPDSLELTVGSDHLDGTSIPEFVGNGSSCSDGLDNDKDGQIDSSDKGCVDPDGDANPDLTDGCPELADAPKDRDGDGIGDACDDAPIPSNRKPTMGTARTWSVPEGRQTVLTARASDPEGEPITFEWDLDGDGAFETPGRNVTFDAAGLQGPTSKSIAVRATDGGVSRLFPIPPSWCWTYQK